MEIIIIWAIFIIIVIMNMNKAKKMQQERMQEHRMSNRDNWYSPGWGSNLDRMWGLPATNTFMIKMNYWFNL